MPGDAKPANGNDARRLYWQLDLKSDEPGFDSHARVAVEVLAA